jgi:outer membrane biosynthesis protein TonB
VSESKSSLDPNDPSYYAPPRTREKLKALAASERDRQALSVPRGRDEPLGRLRSVSSNNNLTNPSDAFADTVARMLREQINSGDAPSMLQRRSSIGLGVKLGAAVGCATLVALAFVVLLSPSQDASDDRLGSMLRVFQPAKPIETPQPQPRVSTLMVRNHNGFVNEPLELGVSVEAPDPNATVTIKGMLPGARLTAGVPLSFTEWRVPAGEVSTAMVIPPADFIGDLSLSAELRNPDGAAQVTSFLQLAWKAATSATALATSVPAPAPAAVAPQAPPPQPAQPPVAQPPVVQQPPPLVQQQQPTAQQPPPSQQPPQTIAALPPAGAPPVAAAPSPPPRADATHELSPNEIAGLVRRAQEMLANGDVKAARVLLLRAAEARDARAALFLAKTFDPIASRQLSSVDSGPDLSQARTWYQRAREWGSPEAQRQLDALASYR